MACPDIRFPLRATRTVGCRPSVFLVTLCELPDCVTQYVQSTLELFLSQCYLLLSFNKAFPTASGRGWPALCASALGLVLLWKPCRKPVGRRRGHPQEGLAAPALTWRPRWPQPSAGEPVLGGPGLKRLKQSGRVGSCQQSTGPAPNKAPPDQLEPGPQSLCSVKECFSLIDSLLEERDRLHPPGAELSQAHKDRAEPQKATLNLKSPASLPRALKCPAQPLSKLGSSSRPQGASLCGSNLHRCISLDSQWPSQPPAQL